MTQLQCPHPHVGVDGKRERQCLHKNYCPQHNRGGGQPLINFSLPQNQPMASKNHPSHLNNVLSNYVNMMVAREMHMLETGTCYQCFPISSGTMKPWDRSKTGWEEEEWEVNDKCRSWGKFPGSPLERLRGSPSCSHLWPDLLWRAWLNLEGLDHPQVCPTPGEPPLPYNHSHI